MKKETWKIKLFVIMHDKRNATITKEVLLDEKFNNKEEACDRIKRAENDLYGFEIPVRLGENLVIKPKKIGLMNLVQIKKLEMIPGDLMDIEFLAEKVK